MQNLVAVSYTVCAHVEEVPEFGDAGAPPPRRGVVALETRYFLMCVIITNFVALGQTVWA